jgi:C-terminal processing protease CtpA/Prc
LVLFIYEETLDCDSFHLNYRSRNVKYTFYHFHLSNINFLLIKGWGVMKRISVFVLILSLLTSCVNSTPTKSVQVEKPVPVESIIWEEMRLTEEKKNNLALLGKIWGYLKYYHPRVAKGEIDWDQELVKMIPKVLQAEESEERDRIFTEWIGGLGEYKKKGKLANWVAGLKTEDYKQQPNLEWISTSGLDTELAKKLEGLIEAKRSNKNHYVRILGRFASIVGIARIPNVNNENPYAEMRYPEVEYRLLSLFRYWNIIEYYFPYKYLIDENWDDVLVEFIPKFIEAANVQEYQLTSLEMVARIQDTHATLLNASESERFWGERFAPVILTFEENKPVMTGYYDKMLGQQSGLKVGDVITKINGKRIEEIIEEKQKYIPASNYPTLLRDLSSKLLRSNDVKIDVEFIRDDKLHQTTLYTYYIDRFNIAESNQKDYFKKIDSDIAYIYIGQLKREHLPEVRRESKDTKGMIIDLRGDRFDPAIPSTLAPYLLPTRKEFAKISTGSLQDPGLFHITKSAKVGYWINPFYYKGKVIILINENTQSLGEYASMMFRVAPDAIVIGSTTAGTDGNVFYLSLPGGIQTVITGMGVYNPDGSQTQRIGIIPDIEVRPTIQGVKEGRDEVLERAVQLINENSVSNQ